MELEHDFTHPRNLYEKLERDSELLSKETNGDNFFNFISTACHLQDWIKKEDGLRSDAAVKRLLKRLSGDTYVKLCEDILNAKKHFRISFDVLKTEMVLDIDQDRHDIVAMKNSIMEIYQAYFHVKGK